MRRPPFLLITMVLALSVSALVHAADDFVLVRFSDYLDALRVQANIPGLAAALVGPSDVMWEGAFGQQDVDRNVVTRADTPFQLDGARARPLGAARGALARHRWRSGAPRTAGCRSTIECPSSRPPVRTRPPLSDSC